MSGSLVPLLAVLPTAAAFASGGAALFRVPGTSAAMPPPMAPAASLSTAAATDLCSSAVRWGLSRLADSDDLMLLASSPHAYWLLREWRRRAFGEQLEAEALLQNARKSLLAAGASADCLRGARVTVRTKGLFSTFHKAVVRQQHVHDALAVRVVLRRGLSDEACFDAHEAIRKMWDAAPGRHKDYVSMPKANGYRAVHDTMVLPSGHAFEVQVRTDAMHKEAEFGMAAHRRYKGALARLPVAIIAGVATGSTRLTGPRRGLGMLQPEAVLSLATKLSLA